LIQSALKEDIGRGDITTKTLIPPTKYIRSVIIARQSGIIAGLPLVTLIYRQLDKQVRVKLYCRDGASVSKGKRLALVVGPARTILTGERVVLNFLQRLSGIATYTNKFVSKVRGYRTRILDTRKTVPGWRYLDKYAVKVGGGRNHRFGLYDAVLVKGNHLRVLQNKNQSDSRLDLIPEVINRLRRVYNCRHTIEAEVTNLNEFSSALDARPDIIMLDNMPLGQVKKAVALLRHSPAPRPLLEVSGGVNLENVTAIARTGVDFISIGALTHSAPALDLAMEVVQY
jgi:nicotinate-nucleotide pyrophosphorylase (carboxylating)